MRLLHAVGLASILQGCSYFSPAAHREAKVIESSESELSLKVKADKRQYRPGEAMILEVVVTNETRNPISIKKLDASTVSFWYGSAEEDRRLERFPVVSLREEKELKQQGGGKTTLRPGGKAKRSFLLTRLTPDSGYYVAQVHMEPFDLMEGPRIGKLYSNVVEYEVGGLRLVERDSIGLMQREDALAIAKVATPGEALSADAILIEDDAGFYKWWVNVDYVDASGGNGKTGYLVDPYLARIWAKAKPFDRSMKPGGGGLVEGKSLAPRSPGRPGGRSGGASR